MVNFSPSKNNRRSLQKWQDTFFNGLIESHLLIPLGTASIHLIRYTTVSQSTCDRRRAIISTRAQLRITEEVGRSYHLSAIGITHLCIICRKSMIQRLVGVSLILADEQIIRMRIFRSFLFANIRFPIDPILIDFG